MGKNTKKANFRDDTARVVADIHDVSISKVQKLRSGDRFNPLNPKDEQILETCVEYQQGKSALIQELKKRVQLEVNPEKYAR